MPLFGLYYCELWGNKYEVHGKSGTVWETRDYLTAKDQGEDPYHCNRFGPLKQHLKSRDDEKTETGKEGMYDA